MDDTSKRLLEDAARAAGYPIGVTGDGLFIAGAEPLEEWNPLENDGQALRLAVKLRLDLTQMELSDGRHVLRVLGPASVDRTFSITEDDPYAATRRAIVRAAAAIGEQTP
jgi:hypothetical protein